jgi:hypothetical protein
VVREPFEPCSHCKRTGKECKIDLDFKRVAKREYWVAAPKLVEVDSDLDNSQLEHLNQQIRDLRQQLELAKQSPTTLPDTPQNDSSPTITLRPRGQILDDLFLSGGDLVNLFDVYAE